LVVSESLSRALTRRTPNLIADSDPFLKAAEEQVRSASVLVIGGAGSIGATVVELLASTGVRRMHVVDIDENGLADLMRRIRSGPIAPHSGIRTSVTAFGGEAFRRLVEDHGPFDAALNLAALKHVRSERDVYSLCRMIDTNVCAVEDLCTLAEKGHIDRVFSVSSDKAVNPRNLMGATKRWMEKILVCKGRSGTSARFANVAFSKGSLPHAVLDRLERNEPIAAPSDVSRFFITAHEAAQICVLAAFGAEPKQLLTPRLTAADAITMVEMVELILSHHGLVARPCDSEEQAKKLAAERPEKANWWPCYFSPAATSGEKSLEEVAYSSEEVLGQIGGLDIIRQNSVDEHALEAAFSQLGAAKAAQTWDKRAFAAAITLAAPELSHSDLEASLDERM
jgi:FlaA1/EpsC-like NDP-sugar epimerase